jgi:drug/metabolite transporter (DMT)-like permease
VGYLLLIGSALGYAVGIVAQTVAACRAERRDRLDPGLLARLAGDRVYLLGFGAQVVGFGLAFMARADLPLYLVQAGAMSAVGIAAVLGGVLLGWQIRRVEIGALVVIAAGLLLLVGAAEPSRSGGLPLPAGLGMLGLLVAVVPLAMLAARMRGPRGALAMGALAGIAFAVLAIASRPLAAGPLLHLPLRPLFWLMVAAAFVGQALLAAALQRGSSTATMASMDSVSVLLSSGAGLLLLGDRIAPGREPWVLGGIALVLCGVCVMAVAQSHTATPHSSDDRIDGSPRVDPPGSIERETTAR